MARKRKSSETKTVECLTCGGITQYAKGAWKRSTCPCAHCGRLPVGTILDRRATLQFIVAVVSGAVLGICVLLKLLGLLQIRSWSLTAGLVAIIALMAHVMISLWDPNASPDRNRSRAEKAAADGSISPVAGRSKPTETLSSSGLPWSRVFLLAAAAITVCLMLTAEIYCQHRGWVANPEIGVVGPGDSFTVYFENSQKSVNARWNGTARPALQFSAGRQVEVPGLTAESDTVKFGNKISDGSERVFSPWATVTMPDRKEFSWREVSVYVALSVKYPYIVNRTEFDLHSTGFGRTVKLAMSEPGAGALYQTLWSYLATTGTIAFVLCGFGLAASPAKKYSTGEGTATR